MLHRAEINLVTPDHVAFRTGPVFIETKTKEKPFEWGGGRRDGLPGHMPAGRAHGIERRLYYAYRHVQHNTRTIVALCFLCIEDGSLRGNSLDVLGEPYSSEAPPNHPQAEMVNWPFHKMALLADFDQRRLQRYFYEANGLPRTEPKSMPSAREREELIRWLRPRQFEIEWFREDLIARIEAEWRS